MVGGGIAGASVAAFLAADGLEVVLLERENSLGYHTTGRSAALYTPFYGPDSMRAFGAIARSFLESPTFESDSDILSDRKTISLVDQELAVTVDRPPQSIWLDERECLARVPFLKAGKYLGAVLDTQVASIDVHALHSIYVKALASRGGKIQTNAEVTSLSLDPSGTWTVNTGDESYQSSIVINAAGAWGDQLATLAGISPVGLVPKRRTVVVVGSDQFDGISFDTLPFVIVEPDHLYFQPFGVGQLMMSPVDQTPSVPCDVQSTEIDKAITVARFEAATTLSVRRIDHSWAGLRTFSPDGDPIIGWETEQPGFFWVVGQGGYGIFTSPAIGRYAASLVTDSAPPPEFKASPFSFDQLSPERFRLL